MADILEKYEVDIGKDDASGVRMWGAFVRAGEVLKRLRGPGRLDFGGDVGSDRGGIYRPVQKVNDKIRPRLRMGKRRRQGG